MAKPSTKRDMLSIVTRWETWNSSATAFSVKAAIEEVEVTQRDAKLTTSMMVHFLVVPKCFGSKLGSNRTSLDDSRSTGVFSWIACTVPKEEAGEVDMRNGCFSQVDQSVLKKRHGSRGNTEDLLLLEAYGV